MPRKTGLEQATATGSMPTNAAFAFVVAILLLSESIVRGLEYSPTSLFLLDSSANASPLRQSQGESDAPVLEPGKALGRELAGGQAHYYRLTLASGQYLRLVVDQKGIDVVVTVIAPDSTRVAEVDSPNGAQGPEDIAVIAETSGSYRVEVRSLEKSAAAGRYELTVDALRMANAQDRSRIAAARDFAEGEQLRAQQRADSMRKALGKYSSALGLWRQLGDRSAQATALHRIGSICRLLGENNRALENYEGALEIYRAEGRRRDEALALIETGLVYSAVGDYQKALDFNNKALALTREISDRAKEGMALNNIGLVYQSWGDSARALEYYGQALPISRTEGNRAGEAQTLINIGAAHANLSEYQKALAYYTQALQLSKAIADRRREAMTLQNIGFVYEVLGEKNKALANYNEALPLRRSSGDREGEASTLNNIGMIHVSLAEHREALDYFDRALAIRQAIGDRRGEATTLNNIGGAYRELGEKGKALDYFTKALAIRRDVGDRPGEAESLLNVGAASYDLDQKQNALDYYREAYQLSVAVGNRRAEVSTLFHMARAKRDLGDFIAASQDIEAALGIVESVRSQLGSHQLRATFFATAQRDYEFYIDLLQRMHKQQPGAGYDLAAMQASERARARSMLELLTEARVELRQGVDLTLLERERALQREIASKSAEEARLLGAKHSDEQAAMLRKQIEDLLAQYEETEAGIRVGSPRSAELTQPRPLNVKEIQRQVVDPDTLVLEYALGKERSFLWAVTPTSFASFELPRREEVERAARRVYELLTARNKRVKFETADERRARVAQADSQYLDAAATLSQILLAPVAPLLGKKRLLIVGDGALQYVPFGALPVPQPSTHTRDSPVDDTVGSTHKHLTRVSHPMVLEHEIVSLPSVSTLAVLRRELAGRRPAPKTLAVLADPVFEDDDERIKSRSAEEQAPSSKTVAQTSGDSIETNLERSLRETDGGQTGSRISRLPFTRREARAISALVPEHERREALDFDASKKTATSLDLGQYRILHFATHGFLNSLHPELSGIVLSLVDPQGTRQDGFVRTVDVYNLRLPAELVVLSGCRTGLGEEIKGEGLVGLTRGFMYAGAARVVVSLWDVNDEATADLMPRFYAAMLVNRLKPAAALRAAQISIWKEKRWQAPYYWAAFVLQGEPK